MNSGQRVVGVVLTCVGLIFLAAIWYGVLTGAREPRFLEMSFPVVFLAIAGVATMQAFSNWVRLSDQAIEFHSLKGDAVLPFDKIKGRRRYVDHGDLESPTLCHLVLEPNDDRFPRLDLEELYRFDDFFYRWFNELPDLDELDKTD